MKDEKNVVACNLRLRRKEKALTQEQLSERSGVAVRTIQRIENAKVEPHMQTLSLLAKSLELEVKDLSRVEVEVKPTSSSALEKKWLFLLHISPLFGFMVPFANFIIPLVIWIYKKDDHPTYDNHGKAVVNFHLTVIIAFMTSVFLLWLFFEIGFPLIIIIAVYTLAVIIINAKRIASEQSYKYPLSLKFF